MGTNNRIMIIDDEEGIQHAVSYLLREAGYSIVQARSGQECLQHLQQGFRGLLLMDIMMPDMDGWDTIRKMAQNNLLQGNIICMLTAIREPGTRPNGLEEHVLDYLPKPFQPKQLLSIVENSMQYLPA